MDNSGLGCRKCTLQAHRRDADDGRNVDNSAVPLRHHRLQRGLTDDIESVEIYADDPMPFFLGKPVDLHPVLEGIDARIVHENIDLAEFGDSGLDRAFGIFGVTHVHPNRDCTWQFGRNGARAILVDIGHDHQCAVGGKQVRRSAPYAARAFEQSCWKPDQPLRVVLIGTDFEVRVWETLLKIPFGRATTYGDIARHLGKPNAARAVGAAVGRNPVSFVVPCHRVLGKSGALTGYHWGLTRKRAILGWESRLA